jgi:hypothetical protein
VDSSSEYDGERSNRTAAINWPAIFENRRHIIVTRQLALVYILGDH